MTKIKRNIQGLMLIELLIGIAMSAIIFIVAASLVVFLFGSTTKSKQQQALEQTKNDIQTDIGNAARWADNVTFIGGVLQVDDAIYQLVDGAIEKNGIALTPSDVVITGFEVFKYVTANEATDPSTGIGLEGAYYDRRDFSDFKFTQIDFDIDFDWGNGSPHESIKNNTFSIRWTGQVETRNAGTYRFYTVTDDGVRLWVNNQLIIDKWQDQSSQEWSGTIPLEASKRYDIRMDYYENGGGAMAQLLWRHNSFAKEIIPSSQLYPDSSTASLEIVVLLHHKNNTNINDILRLVFSPRGGVIGAVEPAPTPTPTPSPTAAPTVAASPTPTTASTPTQAPTPTSIPTTPPSPTTTASPKPTQAPTPTPTPTPTLKPLR
ncbi:hypothetical protein A2801_02535 [Candidatus Woesebacteria bacterium RIFCSPHIGHO2_01_FULL_41_10]|uniref:PA14 domain-containing protein n=1 Tax=Candidatus Woesebacteria bacterium RIFCSPHIGHO2_01_FULL_41_10 TaxID=1802500 RepID=A0A1F7YLU1_9BACT|nr:MAG: hypothetical protein A2801_02535 [Candidatus Woesebacteria bacterium RIFCSPHIGHO2_01_FULL_41_10]